MHEWSGDVAQQVGSRQFTQLRYFVLDAKDLFKAPRMTAK